MTMDEKSTRSRSSPVNQLLRRLRYQGAAQWVTLILVTSCVGLFMFTSSFNSALNRRQAIQAAPSDAEIPADSENALVPLGEKAVAIDGKTEDLPSDLVEEAVPEFNGPNFWDGVDWDDPLELPDKVAGTVFEMTVETGEEDIELKNAKGDIQVLTVFFRESLPKTKPKMDILLLHGSRFNSETWITVDTTKTFAAMGYRATAIDLPGFGNSAGQVMFGEMAAQFIDAFCKAHGIKNPVIVTPSMSGGYALPYLMSRPYNVTALVALAPTSTERYTPADYLKIQVPILTIYGTKDATFGSQVQRRLSVAPNSQTKLIQDAHHATYLDQPDEWHRIAYILFRRLDAWAERNQKNGITTTQHPPVVTHSMSETLAPEVTLPPLNVPPMRKFINNNGYDEVPTGGFPAQQQVQQGGELYGQVQAVNGVPITPEEAAKLQAEWAGQSVSGIQKSVGTLQNSLPVASASVQQQPPLNTGSQNAATFSQPKNSQQQPQASLQSAPAFSQVNNHQQAPQASFQSAPTFNQPYYAQNQGFVQQQVVQPGRFPQSYPQAIQNQPPGTGPVQPFQQPLRLPVPAQSAPIGGVALQYRSSVPQQGAASFQTYIGQPAQQAVQPGYIRPFGGMQQSQSQFRQGYTANQPVNQYPIGQNGGLQLPTAVPLPPSLGAVQQTAPLNSRQFLNDPAQQSNGQSVEPGMWMKDVVGPFQENGGRLFGQAAEQQLQALKAAQHSQENPPNVDLADLAAKAQAMGGPAGTQREHVAATRLQQLAKDDDEPAPTIGQQGLKSEFAETTAVAALVKDAV